MVTYTVTVTSAWFTLLFIKLVGKDGKSKRTWLFSFWGFVNFFLGMAKTTTFSVKHPVSLGELTAIELDNRSLYFERPASFVSEVEITSPEGEVYHFKVSRYGITEEAILLKQSKRNYGVNMVTYTVTVPSAWFTLVFIKLVGKDGESKRTLLFSFWGFVNFFLGRALSETTTFSVEHPVSLGELRVIELEKRSLFWGLPAWFVSKVEITSPLGEVYHFPIYHWIADGQPHLFREAKAWRHFEEEADDAPSTKMHLLSQYSRIKELTRRKRIYGWDDYIEGIPHCIDSDGPLDLPAEVRFSFTKNTTFLYTQATSLVALNLQGVSNSKDTWKNIDEIAMVWRSTTDGFWLFQLLHRWLIWLVPFFTTMGMAHRDGTRCSVREYVQEHWTEDAFFGYQYLNGVNPIMIRRCTTLPDNFPVLSMMSREHKPHLPPWVLTEEMKNGNIFLLDYKNLDGVQANIIDGEQQYLAAPLVLLRSMPDHKLMPIAIQLKQKKSEDNPIFFPTDSKYDWLLAKIYVRSADFTDHQLNVHLLRTHLLAEVFAVSLLRNVPMVHPLYKLLIPHTRYTLQINNLARGLLISRNGVFNDNAASGGQALAPVLQKSMNSLTYSSLCPPDDIKERGVDSVPGYYYRDDALQLWTIIYRYVEGILQNYYKTDDEVQKDNELQKWIEDIFQHGFHSNASSGVPQSLRSVDELVKFATMVIFTGSAQHAAVNSGQFDYSGWMPNAPSTLRRPPPTTKGSSIESTMLETLPNVGITAQGMAVTWSLSKKPIDFVQLGHRREEHFKEEIPLKLIERFQAELAKCSMAIHDRNQSLDVPYTYMDPKLVENSVSI